MGTFSREWDRRIADRLRKAIPVKTGADQLLRILHEKGHPLAVATTTNTDTAIKHLNAAGLFKYLKSVIGGDKVARRKPDPEPYLKAAAVLGYPAENCIAFEDSETGVRAAIASGATTVQVPDLIPPTEEVKALGHLIAKTLIEGATILGLVNQSDAN